MNVFHEVPPYKPLPEPDGMDVVFSKICELISIGQKGEAKKILKQAVSRSEGWSDEEVWEMFTNFTETNKDDEWWKARFFEWIKDYKLKKGTK